MSSVDINLSTIATAVTLGGIVLGAVVTGTIKYYDLETQVSDLKNEFTGAKNRIKELEQAKLVFNDKVSSDEKSLEHLKSKLKLGFNFGGDSVVRIDGVVISRGVNCPSGMVMIAFSAPSDKATVGSATCFRLPEFD
jgi:hypothetical protein